MFDAETKYKVTKIKVTNPGTDRHVQSGFEMTGTINTLKIGERLSVSRNIREWLETSPVEKFEVLDNGNILVETRNSVYSLEKLSDEN